MLIGYEAEDYDVDLDPRHPVVRIVLVLRLWLVMLMLVMVLNSQAGSGYLLGEALAPVPFLVLSIAALVWLVFLRRPNAIVASCSVVVVGTFLRGCEILIYAEQYTFQQRLVGLSLWLFISGTSLVFGVLGLIAASRKLAEKWKHSGGSTGRVSPS